MDVYVENGSSHPISEDYAVIGDSPFPFMIISDGCTSSKFTDVGSAILTLITEKNLKRNVNISEVGLISIKQAAEIISKYLDLPLSALDCTLIIATLNNKVMKITMHGDGCIIIKKNNDEIEIIEASYTEGYPYYLSYEIDDFRKKELVKLKNKLIIGSKTGLQQFDYDHVYTHEINIDKVKAIGITSDGISSFINSKQEILSSYEVAENFLSFKNFQGQFLVRRVRKAIKEFKKRGYIHYDDISIAVYLNEEVIHGS